MTEKYEVRNADPLDEAVEASVRGFLAGPSDQLTSEIRRHALEALRTYRIVLGQERYDKTVKRACERIVCEQGHPPSVEFPGELWFETEPRILVSHKPSDCQRNIRN
jgi:hypothetical protein